MSKPEKFVIGFDLDMTLVDSSPSIHYSLTAMAQEMGVNFDIDAITSRLGPPIQTELKNIFSDNKVGEALSIFRRHMVNGGVEKTILLPGAREAIDYVHELGGQSTIITAKHEPLARSTLEHVGLKADDVRGDMWAGQKAETLISLGALAYVGDHLEDVQATKTAKTYMIAVASGSCSIEELENAGSDIVLQTLESFPAALDSLLLHR